MVMSNETFCSNLKVFSISMHLFYPPIYFMNIHFHNYLDNERNIQTLFINLFSNIANSFHQIPIIYFL